MNKKFWATTFTLSGSTIGAGILGLPYVFSKAGYLSGLFWIIFLGIIMLYINLLFGEITLRTKGKHQISGYANKYLGKWGKRIGVFTMIFGIYSALLAYLVGEGKSLASIIPGNYNPLLFGIIFWAILTFLLSKGLKGLKKVETYGVTAVILIVSLIFIYYFPQIQSKNLMTLESGRNFFIPIGVVLFALLGFTSIPELREEIKGQEKNFKKAIIIGTTIPIVAYIIFTAAIIGTMGNGINEIATLSSGLIIKILGVFTMFTAFLIFSFALRKMFIYDLKLKKTTSFILTSIVPLAIYITVTYFDLAGFSSILGISGVISAGLTGTMILIMSKKAKKVGNPEYEMSISTIGIIILSLIFLIGTILELFI